jgi:hypothetical protein
MLVAAAFCACAAGEFTGGKIVWLGPKVPSAFLVDDDSVLPLELEPEPADPEGGGSGGGADVWLVLLLTVLVEVSAPVSGLDLFCVTCVMKYCWFDVALEIDEDIAKLPDRYARNHVAKTIL